jgi:hypothetical protein
VTAVTRLLWRVHLLRLSPSCWPAPPPPSHAWPLPQHRPCPPPPAPRCWSHRPAADHAVTPQPLLCLRATMLPRQPQSLNWSTATTIGTNPLPGDAMTSSPPHHAARPSPRLATRFFATAASFSAFGCRSRPWVRDSDHDLLQTGPGRALALWRDQAHGTFTVMHNLLRTNFSYIQPPNWIFKLRLYPFGCKHY